MGLNCQQIMGSQHSSIGCLFQDLELLAFGEYEHEPPGRRLRAGGPPHIHSTAVHCIVVDGRRANPILSFVQQAAQWS
jgi:hypothetical protein